MTKGAVIDGSKFALCFGSAALARAMSCASASRVTVGCPVVGELAETELAVVDVVIEGNELELPIDDPE